MIFHGKPRSSCESDFNDFSMGLLGACLTRASTDPYLAQSRFGQNFINITLSTMKSRLLLSLPLIGCITFVSCFPVPREGPNKKTEQTASNTITSEEQQKIEAQREKMRLDALAKETELTNQQTLPSNVTENTIVEAPAIKATSDYPFGTPVPGKDGYVFSPYNNKLLDVRGIPSGTLVQDTTYPPTEKKYFRVP